MDRDTITRGQFSASETLVLRSKLDEALFHLYALLKGTTDPLLDVDKPTDDLLHVMNTICKSGVGTADQHKMMCDISDYFEIEHSYDNISEETRKEWLKQEYELPPHLTAFIALGRYTVATRNKN